MEQLANGIIKHRKWSITVFLILAVISAAAAIFVKINYNMVDYLPKNAQSTTALEIMNQEFNKPIPNASVMVKNVTIMEAVEYKERIAAIDGVADVIWLDDTADIRQPLETMDADTVKGFYKNGNALLSVSIERGMEGKVCEAIRGIIGENNALAGEAADLDAMQRTTGNEVFKAILILVPVIILILILSTTSWLEPVLYLAAIGVSVLINMGSNIFYGEISFMTNAVTPILQLAVSLDYAIFLLHRFEEKRKEYNNAELAMHYAIKASIRTVAASALTTLFGFIALMFMDFRIGADMGLALAKGIVLSFLSVVVFLPALTLYVYKLLDKTRHKLLLPGFQNSGRFLIRLAIPAAIIAMVLIIPSFLAQRQNSFLYGNGTLDTNSRIGRDTNAISEEFGENTTMVLLVPEGDIAREQELVQSIQKIENVTDVISYANTVGTVIPPDYLGDTVTGQFYSAHYARLIINLNTPQEGEEAFRTVEEIQDTAGQYYGNAAYSVGQSTNLYDMKNIIGEDNFRVNLLAVIAIFLVLLFTFKSAVLPFILLLTIETAIWVNMAIPYFAGAPINFIGYLVISTVQLGATVDYAILLTDNYMKNRQLMSGRVAVITSIGSSFRSILVSAATLSASGFILYFTTTDIRVSGIGLLLGRGTLISFAMVVCFLPAILLVMDKAIGKLTWRADFFNSRKAIQYLSKVETAELKPEYTEKEAER